MKSVHGRGALVVSVSLVVLVGCSSPNPSLYTIAPVSGAQYRVAPKVILLQQVGLERYLERSQIVRSSEN